MATDKKKKPRRVSVVFGDQRVSTSPAIAAQIKSGAVKPETHNLYMNKGKAYIEPKRRAVVGGSGIIPGANTGPVGGSVGSANTGSVGGSVGSANVPSGSSARTKTIGGSTLVGANVPSGNTARTKTVGGMPSSANTGSVGGSVGSANVPSGSSATVVTASDGSAVTPAQQMQMQEQKAAKIAPYKADITALSSELSSLVDALDSAQSDAELEAIQGRINAIKSAISSGQQ